MGGGYSATIRRSKPFGRSRLCFNRFDLAIARWRIGHQRIEQVPGSVRHFFDRVIESMLVSL